MPIKKAPDPSEAFLSSAAGMTSGVLAVCVNIREYLMLERYEDGSSRQTSTLSVFMDGPLTKVCLNDRDQGRTLWATGDSVEDCIMSLEQRLEANTADWKRTTQQKGGRRK